MAKKATKTTAKKAPAKKAAKKTAAKAPAAPKKEKAPTAPAAGERADGLRAGSKQAIMLDMVSKPEGATEQELCKALDWKKCRVTLKRVVEKVGAKMTSEKVEGRGTVYRVAA